MGHIGKCEKKIRKSIRFGYAKRGLRGAREGMMDLTMTCGGCTQMELKERKTVLIINHSIVRQYKSL